MSATPTTLLATRPPSSTVFGLAALTDERVAELLVRGDHGAFSELYDRYFRMAVGVARRYVFDPLSAEDIAQESFAALWKHRDRYCHEKGGIRTWLMSITHHRAIDAARRARARPQITATLEDAHATAAPGDVSADAEHRDSRRRMLEAIGRLPPLQREVIGLTGYAGLTHREIAHHTGAPLGTVKGRTRLAMTKLRTELVA